MTFKVPEKYRVAGITGERQGRFIIGRLRIIASNGEDWEHVSISRANRTPRWNEMCKVKALFWDAEDCVIQYHPPETVYIRTHPHVLHLWRPIGVVIPMPPINMV